MTIVSLSLIFYINLLKITTFFILYSSLLTYIFVVVILLFFILILLANSLFFLLCTYDWFANNNFSLVQFSTTNFTLEQQFWMNFLATLCFLDKHHRHIRPKVFLLIRINIFCFVFVFLFSSLLFFDFRTFRIYILLYI